MTAPSGKPRTYTTSAFPGAPGVPGGGDDAPAPPIRSGVVGDNDYLAGGPTVFPDDVNAAFPGVGGRFGGPGQAWQDWQSGPEIRPSTVNDSPGHVSGGLRSSSPRAFYGDLGQGV